MLPSIAVSVAMVLLGYYCGVAMVLLGYYCGVAMVLPWFCYGVAMMLWCYYRMRWDGVREGSLEGS